MNKALRARARRYPRFANLDVQLGKVIGYISGYEAAVRDIRKGKCLIKFEPPTAAHPDFWFDAGYLDNGRCLFMRRRDGASCRGTHGHNGSHWYAP